MILGVVLVAILIFLILFLTSAPLRETIVSITGNEIVTDITSALEPWLWVIVAAVVSLIIATATYIMYKRRNIGRR